MAPRPGTSREIMQLQLSLEDRNGQVDQLRMQLYSEQKKANGQRRQRPGTNPRASKNYALKYRPGPKVEPAWTWPGPLSTRATAQIAEKVTRTSFNYLS